SLHTWCKERGIAAYVVSGDPDLKACCSPSSPLLYSASVMDIVSQANVSKELHDALKKALQKDERLSDELADQIKSMEVEVFRGQRSVGESGMTVSGKIDRVDDINILSLSVLDQKDGTLPCEIEVEAELRLDLDVEVEGHFGYDHYEPTRHH